MRLKAFLSRSAEALADEAPATFTGVTPEITAALAEYERRWGEKKPDESPKPKDNPAPATSAAAEAPAGDAAKEDKAETPPSDAAAEDYSHIPEQYRDAFKALPPDAVKWTKGATERHSTFTQKTQALAREREAFYKERDEQKELVTFAQNVLRDPKAVSALEAAAAERAKGRSGAASSDNPAAPFKFSDATLEGRDEAILAEIDRRAEIKAAAEAAEVERRILARVEEKTGPSPLAAPLIEKYGDDFDTKELDAAYRSMAEAYGDGSVVVTPKNVATLIKPFLPKKGAAAVNTVVPANGAAKGATNGVSPLSRGGGVVAPLAPPPSLARSGPKSRKELMEETLYEVGKSRGVVLTMQDLAARRRAGN